MTNNPYNLGVRECPLTPNLIDVKIIQGGNTMKQVIVLATLIAVAFVIFNVVIEMGAASKGSIAAVHSKVETIDNIVEDPDDFIANVKYWKAYAKEHGL